MLGLPKACRQASYCWRKGLHDRSCDRGASEFGRLKHFAARGLTSARYNDATKVVICRGAQRKPLAGAGHTANHNPVV